MVFVTGGAGFIGANFVLDWLAQSDEPVLNLDALTYAGNLESLASLRGDPRHVFVQGDIADRALLDRLYAEHRPRAVVHFAAESHVDRSIHGPGAFIRTNVEGTFTLLEATRAYWSALPEDERAAFRFHHVSTDEVYGSLGADDPAFTETHPYEPNSPYSASKAASDHLVRAWHHTYGLPVVTTNCSNNYGPFHFPEKLIPLVIVNALAGKPLPVYGDGMNVRDWLYVGDHCAAIREVLAARQGRRDLQRRRLERDAQHRDRAHRLRAARRVPPRPGGQPRPPHHLRQGPPRPRPPLRHRRAQARARARLEAGRDLRHRHPQDGALVPRPRRLGGARAERRLPRLGRRQLRGAGRRMRVLLLGAGGQVGWELQRSLSTLGELVALGRGDEGGLCGDLSRPEALAATVRAVAPGLIVNAAAYTAVDRAESEPGLARTVNAEAPGVLAREARAAGAWLVHYSTDYVFDGSGDAPWVEDAPTAPLSVYGRTKLDGEEEIRASGCRHLILRTSWVYAARGGNFAKTMLRLAAERDRLTVVADQFGAPTGAELLADLTAHAVRAAVREPALSGTYHAAAAGETSWHGYACHVIEQARHAGRRLKVAPAAIEPVPSSAFPTPARRPANSRLDTGRLRAAFGVCLPPWQQGVDRMLAEVLA